MHYSGLMTISTSESQKSDPYAWAQGGSQFLGNGESVQKAWSEAWTLESILRKASSPRVINLLSIDVEESEYFVLKGITLKDWVIEYILIETEQNSSAFKLLIGEGFHHLETIGGNLLFCHPEISR